MKTVDGLRCNTLFLALTRPSMVMGVTLEAFFVNIIVALCAFILAKNVFFSLIWLPLHMSAVVLCRMDKRFFTIFIGNLRLGKVPNRAFWRGVSYEPF